MKIKLELQLIDGSKKSIQTGYLRTEEKLIALKSFELTEPLLVAVLHSSLNTHIDCSGNRHATMVYFENGGKVSGISYVSPSEPGTFGIISQAKNILLLPISTHLDLKSIEGVYVLHEY